MDSQQEVRITLHIFLVAWTAVGQFRFERRCGSCGSRLWCQWSWWTGQILQGLGRTLGRMALFALFGTFVLRSRRGFVCQLTAAFGNLALATSGSSILFQNSFQRRVPTILDGVVGSSGKSFGDLGPAIAKFLMGFQQDSIFVFGPFSLVDVRVEVIVPERRSIKDEKF